MKKTFCKRTLIVLFSGAVIVLANYFVGCKSEEPEQARKEQIDLYKLSDIHKSLLKSFRDNHVTRGHGSNGYPSLLDLDSALIRAFNYELTAGDLTSDLTQSQIDALYIDSIDGELYKADPFEFLEYANDYKTPAFCSIASSIVNGQCNSLPISDIVENNHLDMNEKVMLVLVADCINEYDFEQSLKSSPEERQCMWNYTVATGLCMGALFAATGIAVGEAAASGGTITFLAAIQYASEIAGFFECLSVARDRLELCRRRYQNN